MLVLGSDVWLGGADEQARAAAEELRLPVVANGQARGILPAGHELLMTRARSAPFGEADLVIVVGMLLDFRLGYGAFGGRDGAPRALVVHVADAASQLATHVPLAAARQAIWPRSSPGWPTGPGASERPGPRTGSASSARPGTRRWPRTGR